MLSRTSLLIRLSHEDAARIRKEAASQHRTLSGYLLRVLERSIKIEMRTTQVLVDRYSQNILHTRACELIGKQNRKLHTAIQLCCAVDEAAEIRKYAARRQLSIGDFVVFSLWRFWMATSQLEQRMPDFPWSF